MQKSKAVDSTRYALGILADRETIPEKLLRATRTKVPFWLIGPKHDTQIQLSFKYELNPLNLAVRNERNRAQWRARYYLYKQAKGIE